jgi:hypothetical protein
LEAVFWYFYTPKRSLTHQKADSFPVLVCYPAFQLFATTFTHIWSHTQIVFFEGFFRSGTFTHQKADHHTKNQFDTPNQKFAPKKFWCDDLLFGV